MYDRGIGVKQDPIESRKWFKIAASQGFAQARYRLRVSLKRGKDEKQEYLKEGESFQKIAEQAIDQAKQIIAFMNGNGQSVC